MITQQSRNWLGTVFLSVSALAASQAWAVDGAASKFSGKGAVIETCSITTSFTTISGMTQTFTLGGNANDEVVVTFQGSFSGTLDQFDTTFVRLLIDGVEQPTNVSVGIFGGAESSNTHGFTWISKTLTPGSHTAKIQWRTDLGSSVCMTDRSVVILHG